MRQPGNTQSQKTKKGPKSSVKQAIKEKVCVPDPKGTTSAFMYYTKMYKSGKPYTLEVLYDEASNTILHFMYY